MNASGIYVIIMVQEQKFYIGATGSSVGFSRRFAYHKCTLGKNKNPNPYLQASCNNFGLYNLEFSILEECNDEVLDEREQYWMEKYKNDYGQDCLVNLRTGGKRGFKIGEEVLNKFSEAKKGKNNPNYGKTPSIKTKHKMSKAKKGMYEGEANPMYGKTGKLNPRYGQHHSEETKQKLSEAKKLYWQNKKLGVI